MIASTNVPPDVKRKLEASYKDTLVNFTGSVSEGMFAWSAT